MAETAILYGRASRDPRGKGMSVDAQLLDGQAWTDKEGVKVVSVIRDDNRSAARTRKVERDGFNEVVNLVKARAADLLVCWETSRVSRDTTEFSALLDEMEDVGMVLVLNGDRKDPANEDDRVSVLFSNIMDARETRKSTKRIQRSVRQNRDAGKPHGRIPYGYRRLYDERTGALVRQVPDEVTGDVVRQATAELLAGVTLRAVCARMNRDGVPCPRRAAKTTDEADRVTVWQASDLRQILLKPTNAGRRTYQGKDVGPGTWEALISDDDFVRLTALLTNKDRHTVRPRGVEARHLLSNIARCDECGRRMKASTNQSRMPRAYTCRTEGCMKVTVSAPRAEEVVHGVVGAYFARPDVVAAIGARMKAQEDTKDTGEQTAAEAREVLDAKQEELAEQVENGTVSVVMAGKIEKRYQDALEAAERRELDAVANPVVREFLTAEDLPQAWADATLARQRDLLRALFLVTVKRAEVRGRRFDPRRVDVRLLNS